MISVAACVNRRLVLTSIDSTSLRHTHASHLQAPIKKPLGSAEKHNLQEIIGLTCRYAMRWNMLCRRQSIGEAASLLMGGGGEEVSPEWENKSIASGKVARRSLKYAIRSDFGITRTAARVMKENQYSVSVCRSVARGAEAYLEQSSPAPPPCMPTILREFSVDSVVL